ncbi:protein ORF-C [Elephant endotheliotropic herpesvirus 3A]|uniref:Protein ORF-C n=1 Tax=Elephant endotheliotropic herpesvirus 3A TaxID=1329409 RepID=A0A866VSL1_9BETA|nr:protein ORF-C [Elephant endotheliotropic herpesvirus 3A]QOE74413.1 protein ORF-C [Elephant endotheliotropic herpesvirus 3A]
MSGGRRTNHNDELLSPYMGLDPFKKYIISSFLNDVALGNFVHLPVEVYDATESSISTDVPETTAVFTQYNICVLRLQHLERLKQLTPLHPDLEKAIKKEFQKLKDELELKRCKGHLAARIRLLRGNPEYKKKRCFIDNSFFTFVNTDLYDVVHRIKFETPGRPDPLGLNFIALPDSLLDPIKKQLDDLSKLTFDFTLLPIKDLNWQNGEIVTCFNRILYYVLLYDTVSNLFGSYVERMEDETLGSMETLSTCLYGMEGLPVAHATQRYLYNIFAPMLHRIPGFRDTNIIPIKYVQDKLRMYANEITLLYSFMNNYVFQPHSGNMEKLIFLERLQRAQRGRVIEEAQTHRRVFMNYSQPPSGGGGGGGSRGGSGAAGGGSGLLALDCTAYNDDTIGGSSGGGGATSSGRYSAATGNTPTMTTNYDEDEEEDEGILSEDGAACIIRQREVFGDPPSDDELVFEDVIQQPPENETMLGSGRRGGSFFHTGHGGSSSSGNNRSGGRTQSRRRGGDTYDDVEFSNVPGRSVHFVEPLDTMDDVTSARNTVRSSRSGRTSRSSNVSNYDDYDAYDDDDASYFNRPSETPVDDVPSLRRNTGTGGSRSSSRTGRSSRSGRTSRSGYDEDEDERYFVQQQPEGSRRGTNNMGTGSSFSTGTLFQNTTLDRQRQASMERRESSTERPSCVDVPPPSAQPPKVEQCPILFQNPEFLPPVGRNNPFLQTTRPTTMFNSGPELLLAPGSEVLRGVPEAPLYQNRSELTKNPSFSLYRQSGDKKKTGKGGGGGRTRTTHPDDAQLLPQELPVSQPQHPRRFQTGGGANARTQNAGGSSSNDVTEQQPRRQQPPPSQPMFNSVRSRPTCSVAGAKHQNLLIQVSSSDSSSSSSDEAAESPSLILLTGGRNKHRRRPRSRTNRENEEFPPKPAPPRPVSGIKPTTPAGPDVEDLLGVDFTALNLGDKTKDGGGGGSRAARQNAPERSSAFGVQEGGFGGGGRLSQPPQASSGLFGVGGGGALQNTSLTNATQPRSSAIKNNNKSRHGVKDLTPGLLESVSADERQQQRGDKMRKGLLRSPTFRPVSSGASGGAPPAPGPFSVGTQRHGAADHQPAPVALQNVSSFREESVFLPQTPNIPDPPPSVSSAMYSTFQTVTTSSTGTIPTETVQPGSGGGGGFFHRPPLTMVNGKPKLPSGRKTFFSSDDDDIDRRRRILQPDGTKMRVEVKNQPPTTNRGIFSMRMDSNLLKSHGDTRRGGPPNPVHTQIQPTVYHPLGTSDRRGSFADAAPQTARATLSRRDSTCSDDGTSYNRRPTARQVVASFKEAQHTHPQPPLAAPIAAQCVVSAPQPVQQAVVSQAPPVSAPQHRMFVTINGPNGPTTYPASAVAQQVPQPPLQPVQVLQPPQPAMVPPPPASATSTMRPVAPAATKAPTRSVLAPATFTTTGGSSSSTLPVQSTAQRPQQPAAAAAPSAAPAATMPTPKLSDPKPKPLSTKPDLSLRDLLDVLNDSPAKADEKSSQGKSVETEPPPPPTPSIFTGQPSRTIKQTITNTATTTTTTTAAPASAGSAQKTSTTVSKPKTATTSSASDTKPGASGKPKTVKKTTKKSSGGGTTTTTAAPATAATGSSTTTATTTSAAVTATVTQPPQQTSGPRLMTDDEVRDAEKYITEAYASLFGNSDEPQSQPSTAQQQYDDLFNPRPSQPSVQVAHAQQPPPATSTMQQYDDLFNPRPAQQQPTQVAVHTQPAMMITSTVQQQQQYDDLFNPRPVVQAVQTPQQQTFAPVPVAPVAGRAADDQYDDLFNPRPTGQAAPAPVLYDTSTYSVQTAATTNVTTQQQQQYDDLFNPAPSHVQQQHQHTIVTQAPAPTVMLTQHTPHAQQQALLQPPSYASVTQPPPHAAPAPPAVGVPLVLQPQPASVVVMQQPPAATIQQPQVFVQQPVSAPTAAHQQVVTCPVPIVQPQQAQPVIPQVAQPGTYSPCFMEPVVLPAAVRAAQELVNLQAELFGVPVQQQPQQAATAVVASSTTGWRNTTQTIESPMDFSGATSSESMLIDSTGATPVDMVIGQTPDPPIDMQ